jgi:hypothetical protein
VLALLFGMQVTHRELSRAVTLIFRLARDEFFFFFVCGQFNFMAYYLKET